ncbi:hypothetical protein FisN_18Lh152 [Fistulifera solaris]|uniref:Uncharacterized protein n=1 Tax=Fistulifera solaris TaxID=1519565 RepID=A0A1Z5JUT8_FISSO|nr:hypothetical protein FisN_18Lh152 [Fistulifera solaris]|eukprot:GAX17511.1 hypothetical protein FisN_18Lh152 [Fistulifera solaris]
MSDNQDPSEKLSKCLFSQYSWTVAGVMSATGYSLYKRPKNGIAVMLVAGGVGTMADLAYGWSTKCRPYVLEWQKHQQAMQRNEKSND